MQKHNIDILAKVLLFLLILNVTVLGTAYGNSQPVIINATVTVTCPFSLTLSPSSIYIQQAGASIPYSIKTLTACTTSVSGNVMVENTISNTIYDTISANFANIGQTPTNGVFTISPNVLQQGTSSALFSESSSMLSNYTTAHFQAFSAANITITSLNVSPSSPSQGAQITITANSFNDGSLASSNMILNIEINGPGDFTLSTNTPITDLSPGQSEVTQLNIGGATGSSGVYTVTTNVSYSTTLNVNSMVYTVNSISRSVNATYTVPSPSSGTGGGGGTGGLGQQKPVVTQISSSCYSISNIAALNSFSVSVLGQNVNVLDNFITPNYTGVTVNGQPFYLYPGISYDVNGTKGITISLQSVSYIPVLHTVTVLICQTAPVPTGVASLVYTQMPILTSLLAGNSTIVPIGLHNAGGLPLWANLSTPMLQYGTLSFSSNSLYLLPDQTVLVQMYFKANDNASGSHITPINVTVTLPNGKPASGQFYTGFSITQPETSVPIYLRSSSFTLATNEILTQYSIYNPTNSPISNAELSALMPLDITNNVQSIVLSGEVGNLTTRSNQYVLDWRIPLLQPHGTALIAFSVSNVVTPEYFFQPITTFSTTTQSNVSTVRVFNLDVPTFYVDQQYNISVGSIYTGANQTNLTISLVPPVGVVVKNQVQKYSVFQNTVLNTEFHVYPISTSGTYLFELEIRGGTVNDTYAIPVVVLQYNQTLPPVRIQAPSGLSLAAIGSYALYIAAAIIVLFVVFGFVRRRRGPRYDVKRAEELARVKQRVRRDLEKESNPNSGTKRDGEPQNY
jgi:hypothetical protein